MEEPKLDVAVSPRLSLELGPPASLSLFPPVSLCFFHLGSLFESVFLFFIFHLHGVRNFP